MSKHTHAAHEQFVAALQHEPVPCGTPGCAGPVETLDLSQSYDRVKSFQCRCQSCGWTARLEGRGPQEPPWDDASLLAMAEAHLLHLQAICPFDETPIVFTSLPNPRRRARYRLSCFYCGRQADMDWPPPEAKR
ncbi:hypothetical protein [Candidatus Nitrospira bockiana]